MDISPEVWNTQDTIHRPKEAQEEGRLMYEYFGPSWKWECDFNTVVKSLKDELLCFT